MPPIKKESKLQAKAKAKTKLQVPASALLNSLCREFAGEKPLINGPPCGKRNHTTVGPMLGVHGQNAGKWYVKCTTCNCTYFYGHELSKSEREAVAKQEQDDIEGHSSREKVIKEFIKEIKPFICDGVRKAEPGSQIKFTLTGHVEQANTNGRNKHILLEGGETSMILSDWRKEPETPPPIAPTDRKPATSRGRKRQLSPSFFRILSPTPPKRLRRSEQSPTASESAHASSSSKHHQPGTSRTQKTRVPSSPIDLTQEGSDTDDSILVLS